MCFVESLQEDSTFKNTNEKIVYEPHLEIQLENTTTNNNTSNNRDRQLVTRI